MPIDGESDSGKGTGTQLLTLTLADLTPTISLLHMSTELEFRLR